MLRGGAEGSIGFMRWVHPSCDDKQGQAAGRRNALSRWTTVASTLIRLVQRIQITDQYRGAGSKTFRTGSRTRIKDCHYGQFKDQDQDWGSESRIQIGDQDRGSRIGDQDRGSGSGTRIRNQDPGSGSGIRIGDHNQRSPFTPLIIFNNIG